MTCANLQTISARLKCLKALTLFTITAIVLSFVPGFAPGFVSGQAHACSWGPDPEISYMGFFRQDLFLPQGRELLVFSYDYDGPSFDPTIFNERPANSEAGNYAEWKAVGGFSDADVEAFVYNSTSAQLEKLRKELDKGETNSASGIGGAIPGYILSKKDKALLDYMIFAKTCAKDFAAPKDSDPWEYRLKDDKESLELALKAEAGMKSAPTEFLRLRYAYQAMRIYRARLDHARAIELFEQQIAPIATKSETKEWCRAFYAGALYWKKEYAEAFLNFAKIFQSNYRYRMEGYVGARWVLRNTLTNTPEKQKEIVESALTLAQTPEERAAVLVMASYQAFYIRNSYDITADSLGSYLGVLLKDVASGRVPMPVDLPFLLVWQINEAEAALLNLRSPGDRFNYGLPELPAAPSEYVKADDYINRLESTEDQLEDLAVSLKARVSDPAFFNACISYMAFLRKDYSKADSYLAKAEGAAKSTSPRVKSQIEILRYLLTAQTKPLTVDFEGQLESTFVLQNAKLKEAKAKLESVTEDKKAGSTEEADLHWLRRSLFHIWGNILPQRYQEAGKAARAALCFARADTLYYYPYADAGIGNIAFRSMDGMEPAELKELENIVIAPQGNFETALVADFKRNYSLDFVYEMQGTIYLRQHNYSAAADAFAKIAPNAKLGAYSLDSFSFAPFDEPKAWGRVFSSKEEPPTGTAVTSASKKFLLAKQAPNIEAELAALDSELRSINEMIKDNEPSGIKAIAGLTMRKQEVEKKIARYKEYSTLLELKVENKRDFVMQMQNLERLAAESGELGAESMYAYGKGLYNVSFAGNSPYLYTWMRSGSDDYLYAYFSKNPGEPTESGGDKVFTPADYFTNNDARTAFLKVAELSKNPELKARALFMAALCTQGSKTMYENYPRTATGTYFTDNPDFANLVDNYKDTEFYRATYGACSYLRDFEANLQNQLPD